MAEISGLSEKTIPINGTMSVKAEKKSHKACLIILLRPREARVEAVL